MATSPNYGWEEPDDTDLVKDGALSIRTLGNAIDSTVGTALNNKLHAGLVLVKTQTIGTAVSSVTVTGAFSSTYDNYKIVVSGGTASVNANLQLTFGSAAANYRWNLLYAQYSGSSPLALTSGGISTATFTYAGSASTNRIACDIDINSPYLAVNTTVKALFTSPTETGQLTGYLNDTSSYSAFTLTPASATITGGTIYVYGYAKD